MATEHEISVITNSSIKQPIDPVHGLPKTLHERVLSNSINANERFTYLDEEESNTLDLPQKTGQRVKHAYSLSPRDPKVERLAEELDTLSDEQFYQRLQELKSDHQQTLKMCEQAYNSKIAEVGQPGDRIKDMSRPPLPPSVTTRHAWSSGRNIANHSIFRPIDSSANEDEDDDYEFSQSRTREVHGGTPLTEKNASLLDGLSDSMERIKGMWKDFNIDEYAPPRSLRDLQSSGSGSYVSNKENSGWTSNRLTAEDAQDSWSPIITIPKPFKMMIREEKKQKKKSKAQEELEQKRLEEKKAEEAELAKKFKASPAPAHIYLPLYDEIAEQQETKRRLNHDYREELLRSIEKPFKFYQREQAKQRQKANEALYNGKPAQKKTNTFKANPVPKVLDEAIAERLAEEEEYRKIRVRMRAEELLRESRLPPSMDAREKSKELNRIKRLARELRGLGISSEPTFRPKITGDAPDFDEAHRRLARKLASSSTKEPTVTQPFNLRTSRILSNKERIHEDMEDDERNLPETRWPYKNSRTKPSNIGKLSSAVTSADRMPSMSTQSSELRKSVVKQKTMEEMKKELSRLEAERKRRQKVKKLKSEVMEKAAANDIQYGLVDRSEERRLQVRQEEKARAEEYRRSIKEMQDRVSGRPLLFERTTQKMARDRAERRYNETLSKAGVSPRLMERGRDDDSDKEGSYKSPNRRADFNSGSGSIASPKSASARSTHEKDFSYSNTFTKEDTGLSDEDYSEAESIPEQVLEMA